ncbi:MAG: M56 family metallopeptidase [Pseudomonadota bacterium]
MAGEVLLDAFLHANALFVIAFALWWVARLALSLLGRGDAHGGQLTLLNALFVTVLLAPPAAAWIAHLHSAGIAPAPQVNLSDMVVSYYLSGGFEMKAAAFEELVQMHSRATLMLLNGEGSLARGVIALFCAGFGIGLFRLFRAVFSLRRILAESYPWRRVGRVRIQISDTVLVPFSTRGLYQYHVVLPSGLLSRPHDLRVSLAHEFQHIRSGDLEWEILLEALKPLFYLNPAYRAWKRQVEHLRELACDGAVLSRGRIGVKAYCETLLSVCKAARGRQADRMAPKVALLALGRRRPGGPSLLELRVRSMLRRPPVGRGRGMLCLIGLPLILALALSALAIQPPGDWSQDRLMLSTVVNLDRLDEINRLSAYAQ